MVLAAFILGLPANELVIPIMLMAYTSGSCLTEISSYAALSEVLSGNGWTAMTAVSAVLFTLQHNTADDKEGNGEYRLDCGGGGHTDGGGNRAACGAELHFRMRMPARFEMLRMMLLL